MQRHHLVILLVTGGLVAQTQTIVSPVVAATVEGTSNNVYPFSSSIVRRYQQVHSDIGGTPKIITKLSFRMNEGNGNFTGTAALDTELFLGHSVDWDKVSIVYTANWRTPPVNSVARRVLTWGPQGPNSLPGPNPFLNMDIPLDAPFVYVGAMSLGWEAALYSYLAGSNYLGAMDAESASAVTGASTINGTGCIATGGNVPMTHAFMALDTTGVLLLGWTVANGPSNAPTVLAIGTTNPNVTIPGLCSPLQTNLLATITLGLTNATGVLGDDVCPWLLIPNAFGGAAITTQAHAIDLGRTEAIAVTNSHGRTTTMPVPNLTREVKVTRIWNDTGGTTATRGRVTRIAVGYGLVTQFTY
jgi:hypothetical protein